MYFARMFMQYKYKNKQSFLEYGNLGDCIQNIAVEQIYEKLGIASSELLQINRDDLPSYNGAECKLIMQAWFGNTNGTFPMLWSAKISPIFLGMHISNNNNTRQIFVKQKVYERMQQLHNIGCRDRNTRDFLLSHGVDAYFSGCMTLTFDKRHNKIKNGKIFVVDLQPKAARRLPKRIKSKSDFSITHLYKFNKHPITKQEARAFEQHARDILDRYKNEAKLVITSRIHVAMPCVAMGIPVVFITDNPNDERFDVLRGILPVYHSYDIKYVKWSPKPADIDLLKQKIITNAIAQITGKNTTQARQELQNITEKLKPVKYLPWYVTIFRRIRKKLT